MEEKEEEHCEVTEEGGAAVRREKPVQVAGEGDVPEEELGRRGLKRNRSVVIFH